MLQSEVVYETKPIWSTQPKYIKCHTKKGRFDYECMGRGFSVWYGGMGLDYSNIYFLRGCRRGAVMISIYLKRKVIEGDPAHNGVLKALAFLAPFGIISGLLILVFHLTKPLSFWKIMIFYNPTSVMSMGVILFQVYMVILFLWIPALYLGIKSSGS